MARKVTVELGRNFLNVSLFKSFLDRSEDVLDIGARKKLQRCYGTCLEGLSKIEVNVVGVLDNRLVVCKFRCRGLLEESIQAPAKCFTAIKPVSMKIVPHRNEFEHLAHCAR